MRFLPTLALLALLAAAAPPVRAQPVAVDTKAEGVLPEDSRWLSLVRLIDNRWRARIQLQPDDPAAHRRMFLQCAEDAWYLARPGLLAEQKAPCAQLAEGRPDAEEPAGKRLKAVRDEWRTRFGGALVSPTREEFRSCVLAAYELADAGVLHACSLALKPRAAVIASLADDERFTTWMGGCKKAMLAGTPPRPEPKADPKAEAKADPKADPKADTKAEPKSEVGKSAPHEPRTEASDEQARHCIRTLPSLYEVQWLKKLSDFWTPEEQRALYLRSQQLGQN